MGCGLPSCLRMKSSLVRPPSGWPFLVLTTAEISTTRAVTLRGVMGCVSSGGSWGGAGGVDWDRTVVDKRSSEAASMGLVASLFLRLRYNGTSWLEYFVD